MLQWLDGVPFDRPGPNSLIDCNGEILISYWPRSAGKVLIISWGNAGHTEFLFQSIILTYRCTDKQKTRKKTRYGEADVDTSTIKAETHSREEQISVVLASVNMNNNDVFIEWERFTKSIWWDKSREC